VTAADVRVDFRLRAVREIAPWHDADGANPHLGWFGLSDGWYWIEIGDVELFRYSRAVLDTWAQEAGAERWFARMGGLSYVDYQVAQLWGDLLGFLPDVLSPVPRRLALALASGAWAQWEREAEAALTEATEQQILPKDEASDLLYDATRWLGKRELESGYLVAGPDIRCWSDGEQVHVQWDHRDRMLEGRTLWEAAVGQSALTPAAFRHAISDFNERFLRRMADRIALIEGKWMRPEVALAPHLGQTHLANVQWAQGRLTATAPQEPDDWDQIFACIAHIEELPRFNTGTASRVP
jgi:hypothetical protein